MPSLVYHLHGLIKAAGLAKTVEILACRALRLSRVVSVHVRGFGRMDVRPMDSDLFVLSQIFGWEEYKIQPGRLSHLRDIAASWQAQGIRPIIVDAGANVGYSALYFAGMIPQACVLAIEPDAKSFEILSRHVRHNGNIRPVHAALWCHDRGLMLERAAFGSWSNHVTEGEGTPSERLDVLIGTVPNGKPLIIKLDIEGAEREVVESCPAAFAEAECIMVEPHDFQNLNAACLFPLFKVAATRRFDTILNGENLLLFAAGYSDHSEARLPALSIMAPEAGA